MENDAFFWQRHSLYRAFIRLNNMSVKKSYDNPFSKIRIKSNMGELAIEKAKRSQV